MAANTTRERGAKPGDTLDYDERIEQARAKYGIVSYKNPVDSLLRTMGSDGKAVYAFVASLANLIKAILKMAKELFGLALTKSELKHINDTLKSINGLTPEKYAELISKDPSDPEYQKFAKDIEYLTEFVTSFRDKYLDDEKNVEDLKVLASGKQIEDIEKMEEMMNSIRDQLDVYESGTLKEAIMHNIENKEVAKVFCAAVDKAYVVTLGDIQDKVMSYGSKFERPENLKAVMKVLNGFPKYAEKDRSQTVVDENGKTHIYFAPPTNLKDPISKEQLGLCLDAAVEEGKISKKDCELVKELMIVPPKRKGLPALTVNDPKRANDLSYALTNAGIHYQIVNSLGSKVFVIDPHKIEQAEKVLEVLNDQEKYRGYKRVFDNSEDLANYLKLYGPASPIVRNLSVQSLDVTKLNKGKDKVVIDKELIRNLEKQAKIFGTFIVVDKDSGQVNVCGHGMISPLDRNGQSAVFKTIAFATVAKDMSKAIGEEMQKSSLSDEDKNKTMKILSNVYSYTTSRYKLPAMKKDQTIEEYRDIICQKVGALCKNIGTEKAEAKAVSIKDKVSSKKYEEMKSKETKIFSNPSLLLTRMPEKLTEHYLKEIKRAQGEGNLGRLADIELEIKQFAEAEGKSSELTEALANLPKAFSDFYISEITAGVSALNVLEEIQILQESDSISAFAQSLQQSVEKIKELPMQIEDKLNINKTMNLDTQDLGRA